MLAIKDKPDYDTRTGQKQGTSFAANWVTIDNPDPAEADVDPNHVFKQGKAKGGATFNRLEGCCCVQRWHRSISYRRAAVTQKAARSGNTNTSKRTKAV